jgi:hypothetical protein
LAIQEEVRRTKELSSRPSVLATHAKDDAASGGAPAATSSSTSVAPLASTPTTAPTTTPDPTAGDVKKNGEDPWPGQYVGTDVTRYVMAGQPDRTFDDAKAKIRVERPRDGQVTFTFIDSSNGQDLCTLVGQTSDNEAQLAKGQRCFIDPDDDMLVSSRPGVAKLDGKRLTLNVVLDTQLEIEDARAEGRIEYEFQGQKQ